MKRDLRRHVWPFCAGIGVAALIAIAMVVASGGLVIPGVPLISAFQGAFVPLVRKLIIVACSLAGFGLTFSFSAWLNRRIEARRIEPDYVTFMNQGYSEHFNDLPSPLPLSAHLEVTAYCQARDRVLVLDKRTLDEREVNRGELCNFVSSYGCKN